MRGEQRGAGTAVTVWTPGEAGEGTVREHCDADVSMRAGRWARSG